MSILVLSVAGLALLPASRTQALNAPDQSLRAQYHLTPPAHWLSDPQRPIYLNGKYNMYYLYSSPNDSPGSWRHVTTTDNVVFTDQGVAIPLGPNFPVWTGSAVVDTNNTAGFGAGAVVVLATQPTNGDPFQQEQYLWYSTDGGSTFTAYGSAVISNPGNTDWFRDPKITWDPTNSRWIAVVGRSQELSFYTSADLKSWTHQSDMFYTSPNIGGFECPDIFQIKADDNTTHWVVGASTQGDISGKPDTYAYWTGTWNGTQFTPDTADPQWLDWGWDWYAAVTWPNATSPDTSRYAIGWMDNWHYASRTIPTDVSDNYNGQMSIVREINLAKQADNSYSLLSQPVSTLSNIVTRTFQEADTTVNGSADLSYHGAAYELDADISWQQLNNVGISVGVSADKSRYTNIGIYQGNLYVDRAASDQSSYSFGSFHQSQAPFGSATSVHLTILVDRSSVEVFAANGKDVLSNQVFFQPGDSGISLYTDGGSATFSNLTIKEFQNTTAPSTRTVAYEDFEGSTYGSWTTTGTAFGSGPATGTLPNQQPVTGYLGSGLVNSYLNGDSSTGTLTSPSFTINRSYINFLVGGGQHPRPSDLFADFEGTTWGTGWNATGSFVGQGPTAESLTNQVGAKVLDTFVNGGDSSTGTITSPQFTITRDYIDFLIAGGNHPWGASGATAINLIVGTKVWQTATGNNSGTMAATSWDVRSLIGHTAQIQVVDNATGSWGHLMVDQIVFASVPADTGGDPDVQTTVNLTVNGAVVRTTTGQNSEHLAPASWEVIDLIGQSAQIEIIDNNTNGWGHILADHFALDDSPPSNPATTYEDFEGSTYGSWTTTGTAFGSGPATGTLPNQQPVTGYLGSGLVNSYLNGDSSTGTLTSPSFTINRSYINFLVGGGQHPRPSDLFADFEGTTWGTGWNATGSFVGQGPTAESLTNQVGAKVLDTFVNGGDSSTGTITSPQFTITRDYIDFLIAGGNHPWLASTSGSGATAVNLVVDGVVQRTATGNNSGTMSSVGWDVHSLIGHTAQVQVVDNATGSWGHLMVDQILFTNSPGAAVGEPDTQTTVNLVVGGVVVRTTTGQNNEHLMWASWDVTDLQGQSAQIEIIDNNTAGWGHINVDQFSFGDIPAA